jgi:hypothetical protein
MWVARSDDGGARARWQQLPESDLTGSTGLFDPPAARSHSRRIVLPAEAVIGVETTVIGVETTRATFLSWPEDIRRRFLDELRCHLRSQPEVQLTQEASVTMAQVLSRP